MRATAREIHEAVEKIVARFIKPGVNDKFELLGNVYDRSAIFGETLAEDIAEFMPTATALERAVHRIVGKDTDYISIAEILEELRRQDPRA